MHQQYLAVEQWYLVVATIVQQAVLYGFMDLFWFGICSKTNNTKWRTIFFRKKKEDKQVEQKYIESVLVQLQ